MAPQHDLPFTVELWTDGYDKLLETLARASDFLTAKAAFENVTKRRPGEPIMVRQGARVILKSQPD
ncbi:hypothetical protein AUC71_05620 [Methyloceanibacter marginalis]|uniref:Uncharacterized protein n=1 Tax=Methyloceanibacter marginalis TaxID=1774971 RepID=A0A1E3WEC8_9HYPH|nr:hypothetical protein AUC71_05620 [Methyloceanibacter marginalis]